MPKDGSAAVSAASDAGWSGEATPGDNDADVDVDVDDGETIWRDGDASLPRSGNGGGGEGRDVESGLGWGGEC